MAQGNDNWRWGATPTAASIPLVLWISTAIVAHFAGAGSLVGATIVEEKHRAERAEIREMVRAVRKELDVVEVTLPDDASAPPDDGKIDPSPKAFVERFKNLPFVDDALADKGPGSELEVIGEIGYPLPYRLMCDLLGVPELDDPSQLRNVRPTPRRSLKSSRS